MREHKFAVGDRLQFLPERTDYSIPRGTYTVVRRLPFEHGTCSYRVRNSLDGHERVIPEAQLGRAEVRGWRLPGAGDDRNRPPSL